MAHLNVPIQDDELKRLAAVVPRGMRSEVIRQALRLALNLIEKHGSPAIGVLVKGEVELQFSESESEECATKT